LGAWSDLLQKLTRLLFTLCNPGEENSVKERERVLGGLQGRKSDIFSNWISKIFTNKIIIKSRSETIRAVCRQKYRRSIQIVPITQ